MESALCYLAGCWRPTGHEIVVTYPYDGRAIGRVHFATRAEFDEALDRAQSVLPEARRLPAYRREAVLLAIARAAEAEAEALARTITLEMAKTIRESRLEVRRAILTLEASAAEAKRLGGELLDLAWAPGHENRMAIVRRFPRGIVCGIAPFNFPLNLVVHKLGPALACGAPVIIKPSEKTPLAALALARLVAKTDLPPGMVSVLPAWGTDAEFLATDPRVKVLTFTGSAAVGWALKEKAPRTRVILELGGNAAMVVEPDADVGFAAQRAVAGAFALAGQSCISVQRIFVARSIYRDFLEQLIAGARQLRQGDPLDEETDLGPLVSEAAAERVAGWIAEAVAAGARVAIGGKRRGPFLEATVMTEVPREAKLSCQEVFGPVVTVSPYDRFEEALAEVNRSAFGLQAGLFTRDMDKAFLAHAVLQVGGVVLNDIPSYRADHMPYGGQKMSGTGLEGPRYAIEEMTEPRTLVVRLPGDPLS